MGNARWGVLCPALLPLVAARPAPPPPPPLLFPPPPPRTPWGGGGPPPPPPGAVPPRPGGAPPYQTGQIPVQQQRSNGWLWAIIIILLAVLGFIAFKVFSDNEPPEEPTPTVEMVAVPDLTGLNQQEARNALEQSNLEMTIGEPVESDDVEDGLFVSSNPPVNSQVPAGSSVEVTFSAGVGQATMPDVRGMNIDAARRAIEEEGLVWGTTETVDDHPDYDEGEVVSTNPEANAQIPRGTAVDLQISSGRVTMPQLVGMNIDIAIAELEERGLSYRVIPVATDEAEPDTVVSQNYPENAAVRRGERIEITVAEALPPTPEPTTEEPTTEEPTTEEPTTEEPTDEPTTEEPTDEATTEEP